MQQLFQKYFHKVKFYPSTDNFTQALLVMLVTNIMSANLAQVQAITSMRKVPLCRFFLYMFRAGGTTLEHSTETSEGGNMFPAVTVCPFR